MTIVNKIIEKSSEGSKIIDFEALSNEEKKAYGRILNEQGLSSLGYVRKGWMMKVISEIIAYNKLLQYAKEDGDEIRIRRYENKLRRLEKKERSIGSFILPAAER